MEEIVAITTISLAKQDIVKYDSIYYIVYETQCDRSTISFFL